MPEGPPRAVVTFLAGEAGSVLLEPGLAPGEYPRVALVRRDLADLRGVPVPSGTSAPAVGLFLHDGAGAPVVVPRPEWPALTATRSRRVRQGWWTVLRFTEPVDVAAVFAEVARGAAWGWAAPRPRGARFDIAMLNPHGFVVEATEPVVDLDSLDLGSGVTPSVVASLRGVAGVRAAAWTEHVAALALAGVPVVVDAADLDVGAPQEVSPPPPAPVVAALTAPVDLGDPLAREEHSIVLRRAAFDAYSGLARRQPSVSVLLATRRADMLDFALAQVARQRGVRRLELVLAPHGFDVDGARVRAAVPDAEVVVVAHPAGAVFGDVLHAAAQAASGEVVLKMDDDDWYGPDVVADLLRARAYSGAELVGMSAQLHYLTGRDLTVRRPHPPERYTRFVAGGTMLLDRVTLAEVGGFRRVRKYVDAQLIEAVLAAGGAVYRTHGLGYLLRRNPTGHTWEVDDDYLLDPARVAGTRPGFHPSRLMELAGP